jgi:hypothetical protein
MSLPAYRKFNGPLGFASDVGGITTGTTAVTRRVTGTVGPVGFRTAPTLVIRHSHLHGDVVGSGPTNVPDQVAQLFTGAVQLPPSYVVVRVGRSGVPGGHPAGHPGSGLPAGLG